MIEILFLISLQKPFSYDVFINKDVVAKDFAECLVGIEEINELEMKVFMSLGQKLLILGDSPHCQIFSTRD